MTWFVLEVSNKREAAAAQGLGEVGFHAYVPVVTRTVRRRRNSKAMVDREFLLFPGYIFLDSRGFAVDWDRALGVKFVRGVLNLGGTQEPAPLPGHEVVNLLDQNVEVDLIEAATIVEGGEVRIITGLLQGDAKVRVVSVEGQTAEVMMHVMGALRPVRVEIGDLEKT